MTAATRERSSYRAFAVSVARRAVLGPSFTRVTLTGDDLDRCGDTCLDQRVKLLFASPQLMEQVGGRLADPFFDWYAWWLQLGENERPPMRTYTARAVRQDLGEVDIDFACHGQDGPASRFALTAATGDQLLLVGPDRDVPQSAEHGVAWRPGDATEVLLGGDETAVPAICGILESLPAHVGGTAFLEVPDPEDIQPIRTASGVRVAWLPRGHGAVGSRLLAAVHAWAEERLHSGPADAVEPVLQPPDDAPWDEATTGTAGVPYVWLAGEGGVITGLRKALTSRIGSGRGTASYMGYWKAGRAAPG
jgi:NADPH-dependent ferric siderophore reductase